LVQATGTHSSEGWTVIEGTVLPDTHPAVRNAPSLFVPAPEGAVDDSDRVVPSPPAPVHDGIRIINAIPTRAETVVATRSFSLGSPATIHVAEGSFWRRSNAVVRALPDCFRELKHDEVANA
jgi:hypothetical protein